MEGGTTAVTARRPQLPGVSVHRTHRQNPSPGNPRQQLRTAAHHNRVSDLREHRQVGRMVSVPVAVGQVDVRVILGQAPYRPPLALPDARLSGHRSGEDPVPRLGAGAEHMAGADVGRDGVHHRGKEPETRTIRSPAFRCSRSAVCVAAR